MMIGKVEDVELDENNWAVTSVEIKLEDNAAKLYSEKSGVMKESIVLLPVHLMGLIGPESINLNGKITDIESLHEQIETKRTTK